MHGATSTGKPPRLPITGIVVPSLFEAQMYAARAMASVHGKMNTSTTNHDANAGTQASTSPFMNMIHYLTVANSQVHDRLRGCDHALWNAKEQGTSTTSELLPSGIVNGSEAK